MANEKTYSFSDIEKKWQKNWAEKNVFHTTEKSDKEKFYCLIEFPFPSGAGLHVGHVRPYTAMDVIARKKRMEGKNVLFPIGYDAFGMQAEQYAIKTGQHPKITTETNCENYKKQIQNLGISFDWDREVNTSHPDYYKWTQWMFIQFFKEGLAYKAEDTMNWCPACKLALTNEELEQGKCERCGGDVIQKRKSQWTLRMKSYSEKLIEGLDRVDYTESIKAQQKNWIGKSVGAEINFEVKTRYELAQPAKSNKISNMHIGNLSVFTTRPDTLFGVTFMVIAPEHPLLKKAEKNILNLDEIQSYQDASNKKTDMQRQENKEKTGVEIKGIKAIHPFTKKEIPIFVADYVMMSYGSGAIMAVPAHDQRDYEFAKKFDLSIQEVVSGGDIGKEAYVGDGTLINSEFLNDLSKTEAIAKAIEEIQKQNIGEKKIEYKMRDWLFSRQRYWGEPVPMVYCEKCGWEPLPESALPLELPPIQDYLPTEDGDAPLARATDWVNTTCPKCGGHAKRETDTMPNWAGSSWYYLRYMDPHNDAEFSSKEKMNYWGQVDLYEGGQEHTTRHLLYARFWHKALFDMGLVSFDEPFKNRFSQGLILGPDGAKMSKSKGNVVNPDDVRAEYGTDTLRTYEMFIGPFTEAVAWNINAMIGVSRFLTKIFALTEKTSNREMNETELKAIHRAIKEVGERIDSRKFNTAVSGLMECYNAIASQKDFAKDFVKRFAQILNPFAPHLTEEIWGKLGEKEMLVFEPWPTYDEKYLVEETITIVLQVNGKNRSEIQVPLETSKEELESLAKENDKIKNFISDKPIRKIIVVPKRLVNIVV
ncbi:MAG: leucine--tRNA ligase [Alphaproteobacteria bacterium]|nr:leucine--tRNA ligase [Alphaproteobacteria bacterium]